jgi:hypothetical protein
MKSHRWPLLVSLLASLGLAAACTKSAASTEEHAAPVTAAAAADPAAPPAAGTAATAPTDSAAAGSADQAAAAAASQTAPGSGDSAAPGNPAMMVAIGSGGKTRAIGLAKGVAADTESYTIKLSVPDKVAKGAEAVVTVDVAPKTGWHLNKEFPTKLSVTAPDSVKVTKAVQTAADATVLTDNAGQWTVRFTAAAAGTQSFAGKFKFAVCTDTTCDPKREELSWKVAVE